VKSGDQRKRFGGADVYLDRATEFLFEQAELFAAQVDAAGLAGHLAQIADDVHAALLQAKDKLRRFERAAVEGISCAEQGEDFSKIGAILAVAWDERLVAAARNAVAMIEREECQRATIGAVDRKRTVGQEHASPDHGMIILIDAAANVVHKRGGAEQVAVGGGEIVEVGGEIEEGGGDAHDALLVFDAFEASGNPMCDRA